ncbi:MAG: hypothetical protein AB1449_08465 [Chloroflexota bacterium]
MTRLRFLPILLTLATSLTACVVGPSLDRSGGTPAYGIPEPFARWLEEHGGERVWGVPIAAARTVGGLTRQPFVAGELIYDPEAPEDRAVSLAPLGRQLGLAEPPVPAVLDPDWRYFASTGHNLHPGFAAAFDALGGRSTFGPPIAEAHQANGLLVQAFENLGLVRHANAPDEDVTLLAYGSAAYPEPAAGFDVDEAVLPPGLFARPFAAFLDRYGGEALFGRPLTEPALAADGLVEQVFERAVIAAPPGDYDLARLRPIGLQAGPTEPPAEPASEADALFFPVTGHNVLGPFADFYRQHDGWQLLGLPLEEAEVIDGQLRQRFENAVLTLDEELPAALAVQLAPLGLDYVQAVVSPAPTAMATAVPPASSPSPSETSVSVRTWVENPILPRGQTQRAFIQVLLPDGSPWVGVPPIVEVEGPRSHFVADAPPTGADGQTEFEFLVEDLRPGEIVVYEVFVSGEHGIGYAVGQYIAELGGW